MAINNCFYIENTSEHALTWDLTNRGLYDCQTEYSLNDTENWSTITYSQSFTLQPGEKLFFKGLMVPSLARADSWQLQRDWFGLSQLTDNDYISLGGSLQSLIYDGDGDNHRLKAIVIDNVPTFFVFGGAFASKESSTYNRVNIDISDLKMNKLLAPFYYAMLFKECTGLRAVPANFLPAETASKSCYLEMFYKCLNLESVGENFIKVKNIEEVECLSGMFYRCGKLNKIYADFLDWAEADLATNGWVEDVAAVGDFYCTGSLKEKFGTSYIPEGWNVHVTPSNKGYIAI